MKSFDLSIFLQRKYQGIIKNKGKKLKKFQSSSDPLFSRLAKMIPKQMSSAFFMVFSLILVTAIVGINNYHNSFFHTVYFEEQEIGLVEEVEKVESYVDEFAQAKSSKYETKVKPVENITFDEPEFYFLGEENMENIEAFISYNLNFYTWSYLVTIDDEVSVNLHDRDDYDELMEKLKAKFLPDDEEEEEREIIEIRPAEKIKGEWVKVNPAEVLTLNEAMAFFSPDDSDRTYLASRDGRESDAFRSYTSRGREAERYTGHPINIISVEKEVEEESISYETTYENCDETKKGETEVKTEGEEGIKEIVYHLTKENGEEIEREKVEENVIEEPTDEVVIRGTKKETPSFEQSYQANTNTSPASIQEGTGQFIWPIPRSYDGGGRITRHFSGAHSGIDIYASTLTSTPIIAADSGTVIDTSYHGSYGKLVVINHGNYYTVYAHCSSVKVSNGQNVSQGATIAYMGNTGATFGRTGIHLHFEIRANTSANWMSARRLNPMSFF